MPQSTGESASYTPTEAVRAAGDDVVDFTVLRAVGAVTVMLFTLQGLTSFLVLAGLTVVAVGLYATLPERSGADGGDGGSGGDPDGDGASA